MALFGFVVIVIIGIWLTGATAWCLMFGGEEFSPAKLPVWLICVPLLIVSWHQVFTSAPFTIIIGD